MIQTVRTTFVRWITICGIALVPGYVGALQATDSSQQQSNAELARQILEATGVTGGLIVHVGCGDGHLTAALGQGEGRLVHGLDGDAEKINAARRYLRSRGDGGRVSVARLVGDRLPYIDNLAALVVVEHGDGIAPDEVFRVLRPGGVAYVRQGDTWTKTVKPRPDEMDEWTHYLHGPDNNAVAHDALVAAPAHIQWVGGPKWARHHNHLSSTSAMVSADGRLFAIVDEGPIASLAQPPKWVLVARDAFSGVVLWKRPIGPWEGVLRPFRSGPTELARRLIALGDRVYVTLGYQEPVSVLDAATGKVLQNYADTAGAVEIIADDGVLFVATGTIDAEQYAESQRRGAASPAPRRRGVVAIEAGTGNTLWTRADTDTFEMLPSTMCAGRGRVLLQNTRGVVCMEAATGDMQWRTSRPVRIDRFSWSTPTLVLHEDVVLSADCAAEEDTGRGAGKLEGVTLRVTPSPKRGDASHGELIAFSLEDGRPLWRCAASQGYTSPPDVFVADGLVWGGHAPGGDTVDFTVGRDVHTGKVKRRLETAAAFTETHHHRCYRNKATDRFIFLGRTGVELIDLKGAEPERHCWTRGACQYGLMPANGLLYTPPHSCACYIQSKLNGFWALAPRRPVVELEALTATCGRPLEEGPAYEASIRVRKEEPSSSDWPIHRHDSARSGGTDTTVPAKLQIAWRTELGGRLTSPVVAEGKMLVASIDAHTIHALDAATGKPAWCYTAGGRIDSPPTIARGRAVFGCADGFIYCLRLADGTLVWRYRAAPIDQRTVAYNQVESVWPVTGSVLVLDDVVYTTAGRSSFLDGGMLLVRLKLDSGKLISKKRLFSRDPETLRQPESIIEDVELPGFLPDVLVHDGKHLYLRDNVLDLEGNKLNGFRPHLYCSAGLLDDTWWHRTYWLWGERTWGRASGWHVIPRYRPSGRILVTDADTVLGYGRKVVRGNSLQGYHLFRADKKVKTIDKPLDNNNAALVRLQRPAKVTERWSRESPIVVRGLVRAGDVLFAAGPMWDPVAGAEDEPAFDAAAPAALIAVSVAEGTDLARRKLPSQPVFDGLIAAGGQLYAALADGSVFALSGQ